MAIIIAICLLLLLGMLLELVQKKEAKKRKALFERALKASQRAKALQASRLHEAMTYPSEEDANTTPPPENQPS